MKAQQPGVMGCSLFHRTAGSLARSRPRFGAPAKPERKILTKTACPDASKSEIWLAPHRRQPAPSFLALKIEIQEKLKWDGSQVHWRQFAFSFVGKPGFEKIRGKHIAFEQPSVIRLQCVKHLT